MMDGYMRKCIISISSEEGGEEKLYVDGVSRIGEEG